MPAVPVSSRKQSVRDIKAKLSNETALDILVGGVLQEHMTAGATPAAAKGYSHMVMSLFCVFFRKRVEIWVEIWVEKIFWIFVNKQ